MREWEDQIDVDAARFMFCVVQPSRQARQPDSLPSSSPASCVTLDIAISFFGRRETALILFDIL